MPDQRPFNRFVILEHDFPFLHWDLLLEEPDACRTWRLRNQPAPGLVVKAEPLASHRKHYLDYEGPVSGNRGNVSRWDAGTFEWVRDQEGLTEITLNGARVDGTCLLTRAAEGQWEFLWRRES